MKTILILFFTSLVRAGVLPAQNPTEKTGDTTQVIVGKKTITINSDADNVNINIDKNAQKHKADSLKSGSHIDFFALDLGVNLFLWGSTVNPPGYYKDLESRTGKSWDVGLHFLPTRINLYKKMINIKTALTVDIVDYGFQNSNTLKKAQDFLSWTNDTINYKKNKLQAVYLQIPLMLNFETNKKHKKSFHLSVGGYAGFLLDSKLKQKSDVHGKVTYNDDFNLNRFRYGITARIGYSWATLFVNYNLSSIWRTDQGPAVNPITVGLNIIPF